MADADAAVAIVHAHGEADSVLVIRRAERATDPWSGQWSFPGGKRNREDSGLVRTALRELEEECGIRLARDCLEAALPLAVARRRAGRFLQVAPFVFGIAAEQPTVLDTEEAVEAVWVPLPLLRDPSRHALMAVPGQPPAMRFPAIDLNGLPLWGFTYRLITEWLQLNPPEDVRRAESFRFAELLLQNLAALGCSLRRPWTDREGTKVATIAGPIPVEAVWAHAAAPAGQIPRINVLEVYPNRIRIAGLAFEEYVMEAEA